MKWYEAIEEANKYPEKKFARCMMHGDYTNLGWHCVGFQAPKPHWTNKEWNYSPIHTYDVKEVEEKDEDGNKIKVLKVVEIGMNTFFQHELPHEWEVITEEEMIRRHKEVTHEEKVKKWHLEHDIK